MQEARFAPDSEPIGAVCRLPHAPLPSIHSDASPEVRHPAQIHHRGRKREDLIDFRSTAQLHFTSGMTRILRDNFAALYRKG
jgi:hypothetical protein